MAFAVIKTGGKQYKVAPGETIKVEKLTLPEGSNAVTFEEVLLVDDGNSTKLGKSLAGAKVTGEVVSQGRAKKVVVIHYKNKVRYFKKQGHRQPFTEVKINAIS